MYTLFTMLVLALTLNIALLPVTVQDDSGAGEKLRVDELFYFLQSAENDFSRATDIIGRRAVTALSNRIVNNGTYLDNPRADFRSAFRNGTVNGVPATLMNRSSFEDWAAGMEDKAEDSGYNLSTGLAGIDLGTDPPVTAAVNASYRFNLSDNLTRSRFEREQNVSQTLDVTGIEDPVILIESAGRYTNTFSACRTDTVAERHASGGDWFYDDNNNWTSGESVVRPGNGDVSGVTNKAEKVVIVDDLCSYSDQSVFGNFGGVVSEADAIDSKTVNEQVNICGGNNVGMNALIDDAAGATQMPNETMTVMTEDQVWENNIGNRTGKACYFEDPWAPTVWGRMEGRLSNTGGNGTAFFLTVPDLPDELQDDSKSAVAYVYFNESGDFGATHKIKGVTNEDRSWFRLDQQHVDEWGINALTYD